MPGFRPGRAPRQLVIKRFKKQVSEQVKSSLLMASLEQLDKDYELDPITQPQLDVAAIELPEDGPMNFEMDVEVRPQFDAARLQGALAEAAGPADHRGGYRDPSPAVTSSATGRSCPSSKGPRSWAITSRPTWCSTARTAACSTRSRRSSSASSRRCGSATARSPSWATALVGAKPGETRQAEAKLGSATGEPALRGATVPVEIRLHDLKQMRLPEINPAFLNSIGFESLDELREAVQDALKRRIQAQQRQALRRQILDQLLGQTPFELPADLVAREEASTIRRLVMELRQEGISDNEIRASEAAIRANAHESTLRSLKELSCSGQDRRGRGDRGRGGGLRGGDRGDGRADRREPPADPVPAREGRDERSSSPPRSSSGRSSTASSSPARSRTTSRPRPSRRSPSRDPGPRGREAEAEGRRRTEGRGRRGRCGAGAEAESARGIVRAPHDRSRG